MIVPEAEFIVPWEGRERCVIALDPLQWKGWGGGWGGGELLVGKPGARCSDQEGSGLTREVSCFGRQ